MSLSLANSRHRVDAIEKGGRLQRKVIQLSLEIDDKRKNISLLTEAIAKSKIDGSKRFEKENKKYDLEYEMKETTARNDNKAMMQQCNILVEEKKNLAENLTLLCNKRKVRSPMMCASV